MPRDKPVKLPFTYFRCPRCKRETPYSLIHSRFWRPLYWCESCDSYFVARNAWLLGGLYGVIASVVFGLTFLGPVFRFFRDYDSSGLWSGLLAGVIAVPICWVLWGTILSKYQRYDYVGKNVN